MAKIYKFKKVHPVRVDDSDSNNPLFVANDVCKILRYNHTPSVVARHCKHAQKISVSKQHRKRGNPEMLVIPESDLYRLILRSNQPDAEEFQDWVVEEVLPEIRKTGAYVHAEEGDTDEMIIAKGMLAAGRAIDRLKAKVAELEPKAPVHGPTYRMRTEFRTQSYRFESGL